MYWDGEYWVLDFDGAFETVEYEEGEDEKRVGEGE